MANNPKSGSVAGYDAIANKLAPHLAPRGASSVPTQMFDDLPPRIALHMNRLRDALEMHVEITKRRSLEIEQAVWQARQADASSELASKIAANLAQDLASETRKREILRGDTTRSVASLSRWWTAIFLVGVANAAATLVLAALVGWLLVYG